MAIIDDFDKDLPLLRQFSPKLETLLRELLPPENARVNSVHARVKERDSLLRKLGNVPGKYQYLAQITDLCGARIITYFEDDVDAIAKVMEAEFDIDWTNSVDKRASHDVDRFGYVSVHYIARLKQSRIQLPEYNRFHGIRFELQIRSILQHTWAEIEHDLQYKSQGSVPRELRRRFARLAGLLEIADAEFIGIRDDMLRYQQNLPVPINPVAAQIQLDSDSIKALAQDNSLVIELDRRMAAIIHVPVIGLLDNLFAFKVFTYLKIRTIEALLSELMDSSSRLVSCADAWLKRQDPVVPVDSLPSGISLFYFAFYLIVQTQESEMDTAAVLRSIGFHDGVRADELARELHEVFGKQG